MTTKFLLPKYDSLAEIPEARRDFYVQKGTVWELADENGEIATYFNTGLAANRDALRREHDGWRTRAETAEKEIIRLASSDATGNVTQIAALRQELATANSNLANLNNQLAQAKEKSMPEGHVAMSKEKVTALERYEKLGTPGDLATTIAEHTTYKALGKPDDITKGLEAKVTLEKETAQLKKESVWREAADATQLDDAKINYPVLKDLLTHPERGAGIEEIKFADIKGADDKMVRTAVVVVKEGDAKVEKPLAVYIAERTDWQPYVSSLKTVSENGGNHLQPLQTNRQVQQTRTNPPASGGKGDLGADLVTQFNAQRSTRGNPLETTVAKPAGAAQT